MMSQRSRTHGRDPFRIVLVHGGPGGAGELFQLAEDLSEIEGVLEPLQSERTVSGQVEELGRSIEEKCSLPVILVGFSWGAWLSWILASTRPEIVSDLVLIGSGPFTEKHSSAIMKTRLSRLERKTREEVINLISIPPPLDIDSFRRFARIMADADSYDPINDWSQSDMDYDPLINAMVWKEAVSLRRSGMLLRARVSISCPITIIHGDFDPHPADGVVEPLKDMNPSVHILEKCGHRPWIEKHARKKFMEILEKIIRNRF
jgi:pimeloyl-ACP methyl ester carboxylesterase